MSHQYTYDNLERLAEARRGVWSQAGSTFTVGDQSQKWNLDPLGNWNSFWASANPDPFGPGLFPSVLREDRAHNEVNELIERSLPDAGGDLDLTYDAAGNLILQEREAGVATETIVYTWDAWNRLVRVVIDTELRSETEYNGLTHRTIQRADTTGNGVLDQERRFTYDASWRIAEELVGPAGSSPTRRVQHIWGNRYIDDLILRRIDANLNGTYDADWYHLTDVQFSTVAVIEPRTSQNARVHERITYDAYGRARHHWGHDVNGDGAIRTSGSGSDLGIIQAIRATSFSGSVPIADAAYRTEADVNRDGIINAADESALGSVKTALTYGELSDRTSTGPESIIGWCGYVFVPETQFYHVRFRVYDTGLGRWKTRDPLGYVDGMGVYEYVEGRALTVLDSTGLCASYCGPDVTDWFRNELKQNCSRLRQMDAVVSLAAWVSLVWNHSEWDYKRRSYSSSCFGLLIPGLVARCPSDDCKPTVELCGICFHREVLGNINYGYTGRCIGLSEKVLLRGAELAAHIFGGIEDRCDRTGIRLGAWLQGGLVEGVVYFLASGKLRPPRDLCSAVRAFGLKDACKKWDHCKPCPCRFNHL